MINRVRFILSEQTVPYQNLALEEYLLQEVTEGECILYLWQNRQTVVVGRNQNCWKECKVEELQRDGGYLVRRLSGGGAVFHDLGNLNFTFLVRQEDYNVERQLEILLNALQKLGIQGEKSGRNDITVQGKKCSGNAFYSTNGHCYHHGTLLLGVDMENLSRYLNVSVQKLQSNGVASVKARVANLTEFNPEITADLMCEKLIEAFGEGYGCKPQEILMSEIDQTRLSQLTKKFSSREWLFGSAIRFTYEVSRRFDWGDIQLLLKIKQGRVAEAAAYSDALEQDFILAISRVLVGASFETVELASRMDEIAIGGELTRKMTEDIKSLLLEQEL